MDKAALRTAMYNPPIEEEENVARAPIEQVMPEITRQAKLTTVTIGDQSFDTASPAYLRSMEKAMEKMQRDVRKLEAHNRRLVAALRDHDNTIRQMQRELDNKLDMRTQ